MMRVKFHFWYKDNHEDEEMANVEFIPDMILHRKLWFKKENAVIDFDDGTYTKVHYNEYETTTKS